MTDFFLKTEELAKHIKEYVDTKVQHTKLLVAEKASRIISDLIARTVVLVLMVLFVLFASIALAFALAEWTGALWAGFLIVAGIYLLIVIIVWSGRERFIRVPVMNNIVKQLFSEESKEDEKV
jgi:uncharacterized membrane protein